MKLGPGDPLLIEKNDWKKMIEKIHHKSSLINTTESLCTLIGGGVCVILKPALYYNKYD